MREPTLSPSTRALLKAARSDGPRMAARAKMWGAVSAGTGVAAAAGLGAGATAGTGTTVAAASSAKLLVAGALFGSTLTVGIALAVVRVVSGGGHSLASPRLEVTTETVSDRSGLEESRRADPPAIPLRLDTTEGSQAPAFATVAKEEPVASPVKARLAKAPGSSGVHAGAEDPLWREESLILEARGALRRGNPEGALASLDAARSVGSHVLEPEELSVRAKTLRALGREAEANDVAATLKARYPDQAR
jgi:hypothetical protein